MNLYLDRDPEAPMLFAVWNLDGEILGAGDTADEALTEARKTLEEWRRTRLFAQGLFAMREGQP